MKPGPETRRRLYREGKRLLGPDRMRRLRDGGRSAAARLRRLRGRALGLREGLRSTPWVNVDRVVRVDRGALLVGGRLRERRPNDGSASSRYRLSAHLAGGEALDVTDRVHRYVDHRAALLDDGSTAFALTLELAEGERLERLSVRSGSARDGTCRCPPPDPGAEALPRVVSLLGPLAGCADGKLALLDAVVGPAVARAWASARASSATDGAPVSGSPTVGTLVRYNEALAPSRPRTTLVVPLYGRHDFVAHQLAHFADDPELRAAELLYVLDDPRLEGALRESAARLEKLHDLAFSVLYLPRNVGYAGANNAGAARARGEDLLLLNSDVLPAAAGWLGRMYASVGDRLEGSVVGARLLYADGTVQHDGMRFEMAENFEGLWLNRHPGKGLPSALFADAAEALPREAVTGACLLVTRRHFLDLGGFDEDYVLGDFEDSDFCLKAHRAGLAVAIAPRATLYHLERQSQSMVTRSRWKEDLTHYNCWTHSRRWHEDILQLHERGRRGG